MDLFLSRFDLIMQSLDWFVNLDKFFFDGFTIHHVLYDLTMTGHYPAEDIDCLVLFATSQRKQVISLTRFGLHC